jgi:PAS domain S-box-containing protein
MARSSTRSTRRSRAGAPGPRAGLRASERRFRALIENSAEAIALFAVDGTILYGSPATTRILGYALDEFVGRNAFELIRVEDHSRVKARLEEALLKPGIALDVHAHVRHRDGSWRLLEGIFTNLLGDPSVGAIVNNYRDVTERKRAEEALRHSEERFTKAFRSSPAAMSISTMTDGRYRYVNGAFLGLIGYREDEVVGHRAVDVEFWGSAADRERAMRELRERGSLRDFEAAVRRKSGEVRQVLVSLEPFDLDGEACLLGFSHDITERKLAEEALRESQAFLEAAQAVAHVGSWVSGMGPHDRLWWSKETHRIFGIEEAAFDGRVETFFAMIHEEDLARVGRASEAAIRGEGPYQVEHRVRRPGGEVRWVYEQAEIVRDPEGRPLRMIGTVQDITERRYLEDQLRLAQKMEAVGRLAGGVAHDFNNMLGVILGYAELLVQRLPPEEPLRSQALEIRRTSERAAALTRQLLAFSRRQVLQPRILDLSLVVSNMEEMLRRLIGEDVHLVTAAEGDLGLVKADPGQIEQVIMNLAVNARDAMPGGGRLTIATANVELDEARAAGRPGVQPGPYVMLSVSDTGGGMDAETLSHLFEPFFTTKEPGRGTGLGLATAYGIVKQSDGHIWVMSEPGHGTSVTIYLPRVEGLVERAPALAGGDALPGGSETILLVEDEDSLRELAHEILGGLGYTVLEAGTGRAALEVAERHPGPIDLLLTDVIMPGMSGRELAAELLSSRPGARALYMSGYTDDAIIHGVLEPGLAFLQKPFPLEALARKVREVLDQASG